MAALTLVAMACGGAAQAQNGFNLPYSRYGIGMSDLPYTMPMAMRTGGAVYTRSGNNFINPFNPASYASIERESFVFDMGLNIQTLRVRADGASMRDADGNIGHLAIGLPLTRWWKLAAGMMPYSTVAYETTLVSDEVKTTLDGIGGVNQFFGGMAFNIPAGKGRTLQAGFNASHLTGDIQRAVSYTYIGTDTASHIDSRRQKTTHVGHVVFDFGVQFRQALGERYTLGLGLSFKPYTAMTTGDTALVYTYRRSGSSEYLLDTVFPARGASAVTKGRLVQPNTFGVGVSIERNGIWRLSVDNTFAAWQGLRYEEDASHSVLGADLQTDGSFSRHAVGFEKLGDMDAASYWGRIGWSLGAHGDRGVLHLTVDGASRSVNRWGVGAGASLPMRKGKSLLTLSVDYSSLGAKDLLQQNVFTVGISVGSCERWFVKRKYN